MPTCRMLIRAVARSSVSACRLAGLVVEPGPQRQVPSGTRQAVLQHLAQENRIDVSAAHDHANALPGGRYAAAEDGGQRGGAGAFGELLVALEQQQDRARDRFILDGHQVVDEGLDHGKRARAGSFHGNAVGNCSCLGRPEPTVLE